MSLAFDRLLGRDDWLGRLDEVADSLDRSSEDGEGLDGLFDEPAELGVEDLESELPESRELLLAGDRLADDNDDFVDDSGDEPLLFRPEDSDELVLLMPLLEEPTDDCEPELRDRDDLLPDEPDELGPELLWSELLGEIREELPEETPERDRLLDDRPDDSGLLDSELRRLLLGLLFNELSNELEPLLWDDSLDELGDDRDNSLTLENDLLDPETTDEELILLLPDRRYE